MGPSRRRGAGKAAAAAAARRQWKVGDLVLAKVKGFPAWPATVSEPEKWGYSADWKKVLVYFFGTQQIAFCNPADVEAFTEEKKQSLLIKRQGKGADFVRAVQEIIDSYEKLKKQNQVDDFNSGQEVGTANGGNSLESSAHIELKDRIETSEATVTGRNDSILPAEDTASEVPNADDKETLAEQSTDGHAIKGKPIITTYTSRKRSGGLRSRKRATQKKEPPVERSRNSSRLDSYRFQNLISDDGNKISGDASSNIIRGAYLRRNKRIRKSPDASECDDVDSSVFVSNGSVEDNGSEIVTVDSDSFSLNEGSGIDSGCKPEHSETVVECLEGDDELSKGLDFEIKAVVIKKKRKLNRKRATHEVAEPTSRQEMEVDLDVGVHNSSQDSQNVCENLSEQSNRDDGDEHLPLVKRARVRMSKSSCLEEGNNISSQTDGGPHNEIAVNPREEHNRFCQAEERSSKEAAANILEQIRLSANCNGDFHADSNAFHVDGDLDNALPSKDCTPIVGSRPHISRVKENQSLSCSADGEAALPPSKRLHRALEAMSANVAEEVLVDVETSTSKTVINDGPLTMTSSNVNGKSSGGIDSVEHCLHVLGDTISAFCTGANTTLEDSTRSSLDIDTCSQPIETSKSEELSVSVVVRDHDDIKKACSSDCAIQAPSPLHLTPALDRRLASQQSDQVSMDRSNLKDEGNALQLGAENLNKELGTSEHSVVSPKLITCNDETSKLTSENSMKLVLNSEKDAVCENIESLRSQIDENSQSNDTDEVPDVKDDQQKRATYVSAPEDDLGEKDGLGLQSSPFPADATDTPAQTCPLTASICHVSTSESTTLNQNSSSSSPNTYMHQKKPSVADEQLGPVPPQRPKSVGRGSNTVDAHAALSSFEGLLGSLTRTKESIGRATRVAIDCGKFGVSAKVVDILTRTLENESSLHRRVDLFFLVDSVLKGDGGGIYPSAIQAVLPRLLSAAAPPGSFALENRRQCLKVLRLWLERKVLPESVIRQHMRELEAFNASSSAGPYSRRSARTERALDDPVRDMEGMLVDEYGSNSSLQLPGFCMPCMLKDEDEGSDSDGESFEAVTPEHNSASPEEQETTLAMEKHTRILEDVDGELEMEDVAPSCDFESMQDDPRPTFSQSSEASAINPSMSNPAHYPTTKCRDQPQMQHCESTNSFSNHPVHSANNVQSNDGASFHHKAYPPRPPHPPHSNQFSYVQGGQHVKSRRENPPPPYSHRYHSSHNADGGNFYSNHERMRPGPYEPNDGWRYPAPPFPGPRYHEKPRSSYAPAPYGGPPREPNRLSHHGWGYPPRGMHHRNYVPFRPSSEEAVHVANRAPSVWRPR